MKATYRGHTITAKREKCLAGYPLLFVTVYRERDGFECVCHCEDSAETEADMIGHMMRRIDEELAAADPWGEWGYWPPPAVTF